MSKNDSHLPVYGVGPYLIIPIVLTAIMGLILTIFKMIPIYEMPQINLFLTIWGLLMIILGAFFWVSAVKSRIDEKIKSNQLETSGIYGIVRHPIYAAFLYASTGIILISNNLYLLILPIVYWIFLSISLQKTEEKWLIDLYGDDYIKYSKKVNRFFPKVI